MAYYGLNKTKLTLMHSRPIKMSYLLYLLSGLGLENDGLESFIHA